MNQTKKIVVTIWLASLIVVGLYFLLPAKADRYFLSARILTHESELIHAESLQKKNIFQFLKSPSDNDQLLKMLQTRVQEDARGLLIHLGVLFVILNTMACLLYIFHMKPVRIVMLVLAYVVVAMFILMQSFIKINP